MRTETLALLFLPLFACDPESVRVDIPLELGLCIKPAVLEFGAIPVGMTKELPLALWNCDVAPLDLLGAEVYLGNAEFALTEPTAPSTLLPTGGLKFELAVRYTPKEEGEAEGRIRITTSNGIALVQLIGNRGGCRLVARDARASP